MRLDEVQAQLGDAIAIEWKAFMLRPTEPKSPSFEAFVDYTKNWARMVEMEPAVDMTTPWATDNPQPSHSLPALAASKLARTYGSEIESAFHHRMLEAYFTENRTISDLDVITNVGAAVGLDPDEFRTMLQEQQQSLAQMVIDDHNEAVQQGISAVPTVVLNGMLPIPGAQDTENYVRWIEKMIDRRGD